MKKTSKNNKSARKAVVMPAGKILVYHGAVQEIRIPDLNHSRKGLDFGVGFYVTEFSSQAVEWARIKAKQIKGGKPCVNVYEFDKVGLNKKEFRGNSDAWLDFVVDNRLGNKTQYVGYDYFYGEMADDTVYNAIRIYIDSIRADPKGKKIYKARLLHLLSFRKATSQFCLVTQTALERLTYKGCKWL